MAPPPRALTTLQIVVLVVSMIVTGSSNSLWSKAQDMICVSNCDSPDPSQRHLFEQPIVQSLCMFMGEMLCLIAFHLINSPLNIFRETPAQRRQANFAARQAASGSQAARLASNPLSRPDESAFNFGESAISLRGEDLSPSTKEQQAEESKDLPWNQKVLFWAPAACDICGTTAMNVGLLFVPVSVYQMLRGGLVIWVGVLSFIFLGRRLSKAQWTALGTVMAGVAVVGSASMIGPKAEESRMAMAAVEGKEGPSPLLGVGLIFVAQIFTASQFVLEEKIMERHSVEPLLAAGYEGLFGFSTTMVGFLVLHYFIGSTPSGRGGYFDAVTAYHQVFGIPSVWGTSIIIAVSIALFNFCGLAVTKSVSATARSTIDTSRTVMIWLVSMAIGWEQFKWIQVVGFSLLVYGTFVFNGITTFPDWTGLHKESIPSIVLPDEPTSEDEDEDEEDNIGRSRSVDNMGRPVTRRSGSGRRGEISPLLKNIDQR